MSNYILLIYPIALFCVLFFGASISKKGEYREDCWSRTDSKNLQAVAAFFIILHHLVQSVTHYGDINKGPVTILCSMGILFTSIFFFYSGYGLIVSYNTKEDYLNGFLKKRLTGIFIPFMLANVMYLLVAGVQTGRITNLYQALTSLFGITLINTNAWFIIEIFVLYIAFYFCFKYIKSEKTAAIILLIFTVIMIVFSLLLGHDYSELNGHWFKGEWWYNTTILFPVGIYFGLYRNSIKEYLKKNYTVKLIIAAVSFVALFVIEEIVRINLGYYKESYTYKGYPEKFATLASQIILCVSFIILIMLITMKVQTGNKVLKAATVISMDIYLVHDLFMLYSGTENNIADPVFFGLVYVESVIAAIILHFISQKLKELFTNFFLGMYNNAESFEAREEQKKIRKILKSILAVTGVLAVITVFLMIKEGYDSTIARKNMIESEKYAISCAGLGDVVTLGHFNTEYMTDGTEPLEWIVIDSEDDKSLLLCKQVIFGCYYNQKHKECSYENSDIRDILINEGYYEVFHSKERELIVADEETGDMIFLLSESQAEELFESDGARIGVSTPMGERIGVNIDNQDKNSWWWLRGNGTSIKAPVVSSEGKVLAEDKYVNVATGGVRPAIWVSR